MLCFVFLLKKKVFFLNPIFNKKKSVCPSVCCLALLLFEIKFFIFFRVLNFTFCLNFHARINFLNEWKYWQRHWQWQLQWMLQVFLFFFVSNFRPEHVLVKHEKSCKPPTIVDDFVVGVVELCCVSIICKTYRYRLNSLKGF